MAAVGCLHLPVRSLSLPLATPSIKYGRFGNKAAPRPHCFPVFSSCSIQELMPPKNSKRLKPQTESFQAIRAASLLGCSGALQTSFLQSSSPLFGGIRQASSKLWRSRSARAEYGAGGGGETVRKTKVQQLRTLLGRPGIVQGPACHDALSAHLIERAGFKLAFMSGFSVSATRLAEPDTGLISYGEMVDQARLIASATSLPVIGDGDTGYGNAMNVKRTVRGYASAGMAGILIEDQVSPKACGHTKGRKVVSREEAVLRIRAAVDARDEGDQDIVIVARTDARQADSLAEAIWRAKAFADAGADVVFIDALASKAEMKEFCQALPNTPKMANMLEGGGKSPTLTPLELQDLGFKLVAYPLSLLGVSIRAMEDALKALKTGRMPPPSLLPTFDEVKEVVGFNDYYKEEERYASPTPPKSGQGATSAGRPSATRSDDRTAAPVEKGKGGSDVQSPDPPKPKPKTTFAAPPPPSVDEIAKRRAEWGLESPPNTSSSGKPANGAVSGKSGDSKTEKKEAVTDTETERGAQKEDSIGSKSGQTSSLSSSVASTDLEPGKETDQKGDSKSSSERDSGSGLDSIRRLDGTRPGEPTVAEAALRTAEEAAARALEEAEKLVAQTERKAGGGASSDTSSRKESVEVTPVEVQTADGWKNLSGDETSRSLRSEMGGLPGLRGRMIRVRILGPNGENKLEFNVPAGFLDGLSSVVPGVAGLDLRAMLEESLAQRRATTPSGAIVDVVNGDSRIQIFLE